MTAEPSLPEILETAESAARAASETILKSLNDGFSVSRKSVSFDRVTSADLESERIITGHIRAKFRDHNIFGEEGGYGGTDSPWTWVIDPIDGTNNFIKGIPQFSISIAVRFGETTVAGVVYDPSKDELFSAGKGAGAYRNGSKIGVSRASTLGEALLITGFYYDRDETVIGTLETMKNFFMRNIIDIRRFGSAALDLCYVACGRAEGYWEHTLSPWDYAAGALICEEAGGTVTTDSGENPGLRRTFIVASNTLLHREILDVINLPGTWK